MILTFALNGYTSGVPVSDGQVQSSTANTGLAVVKAITNLSHGSVSLTLTSGLTYLIELQDGQYFYFAADAEDVNLGTLVVYEQGVLPENADITARITDIVLGNVVNGVAARGSLTFVSNPANNETIAVNGLTFTFKSVISGTRPVAIGATKEATAILLAAALNASVDPLVSVATYEAADGIVSVVYDTRGIIGNTFTLADSSAGAVTASGATLTGGANSLVTSGTYTPTSTNTTNATASTPTAAQYARVGSFITVSGQVSITPTAAGAVVVDLTLPIASDLQAARQLAGTGASAVGDLIRISAEATSNKARFEFVAVDTTPVVLSYQYGYLLI